MRNSNDPADDGEELATPAGGYRALLETTRPLVITKNIVALTSQPWIYRDQPMSLEAGHCHGESVLKIGEIVCPDPSGQTVASDESLAGAVDLPLTSSRFRIRIYIGMS